VTLKVNLKGYHGNVKKTATVFSNDPQNQRASLVLQGNVKAQIDVQPSPNIAFRGMAEQVEEKTIDFVSTSQRFTIPKIESNLEGKAGYKMETVEEGKHYRLKVTNLLKQGSYNGFIKCYTDVAEKPEITLRVSGSIDGEVSVKPSVLLVGKMAAQQPVRTGKVLVVNNRNKPFQIKKLTYDDKLMEVKQEPLPKEPGYSIEITPKMENVSTGAGGRLQTMLSIETDVQPDEPQQIQIHIVNINVPDTVPPEAAASPATPSPAEAPKATPQ
jgi:hypothetical protein